MRHYERASVSVSLFALLHAMQVLGKSIAIDRAETAAHEDAAKRANQIGSSDASRAEAQQSTVHVRGLESMGQLLRHRQTLLAMLAKERFLCECELRGDAGSREAGQMHE